MIFGIPGPLWHCPLVSIPKIVQERLGHANVSITLDVYSHVSEGLHSDAASRVAKIIFGPVSTALANTSGRNNE